MGEVTGNSTGGFAYVSEGSLRDVYWDVDTTNQSTSGGGTGLTTGELTGYSTPHTTALDFTNVWDVVTDDGSASYPYLQANSEDPRPGLLTLYAGSNGSVSNPYEVANWNHLDNVRENPGANYTVSAGLDSETYGYDSVASPSANGGSGFYPIGVLSGTFDGQNDTIANLTINRPSEDGVGLFAVADGMVRDVSLLGVNITGDTSVGGLAGHGNGSVDNVAASGTVNGSSEQIGGLVGMLHRGAVVKDSTATVTVTGTDYNTGGLVGESRGTVSASFAMGDVTGVINAGGLVGGNTVYGSVNRSYATGDIAGNRRVGGLTGASGGTILESNATGAVTGNQSVGGLVGAQAAESIHASNATGPVTGNQNIGGLVGSNGIKSLGRPGGKIDASTASGTVTIAGVSANPANIGGLVGKSYQGTVKKSNATGDVNGDDATNVGGLVGYNDATEPSTIRETHATGAVDGGNNVGGLIGININDTVVDSYTLADISGTNNVGGLIGNNTGPNAKINRSYATGKVSASGTPVGGLVGTNENNATAENAYWDIETTGQSGSQAGTGLTTAEMKGDAAKSNMNFTFGSTWKVLDNGTYISYPYLQANPQDPVPGGMVTFTEQLVDRFENPPQNVSALGKDPTLYEDLNGDGDGTSFGQTVAVFGELIRDNDLGLTDAQARKLDWDENSPETEVTVNDMISLFGEQMRAD